MATPVVEFDHLSKYYGKSMGVEDVHFTIEQGEIFGFVGPNGAGKSTSIRVLLGLLKPSSGKALVFGREMTISNGDVLKRIGYLPSEVNYYEKMTAHEMLKYSSAYYKIDASKRINELSDYFELNLKKKISDLSQGNKKKVAIIQSVIHNPDLIILDEPTSGLDPLMQNRFFELLHEENKRGATIFFSSHILAEIQRMCNKAAVIRMGEISAVENIHDLLNKQMKRVQLIYENELNNAPTMPEGSTHVQYLKNKLNFDYVGSVNELINWISNQNVQDVSIIEPDLESIFMNYYERD